MGTAWRFANYTPSFNPSSIHFLIKPNTGTYLMQLSLTDLIGILGVIIIIIAYMLLQLEKMDAKDLSFSVLNSLGALFIIISLYYDWNLASFLMEATWMIISLYGILKYYKMKKKEEENTVKKDGI